MTIHKEGYNSIIIVSIFFLVINAILYYFIGQNCHILHIFSMASFLIFLFVVRFFRSPNRQLVHDENSVLSPADGEVVVIEKVTEGEYFKDERIQISIFMSAWDIHMNRYPLSGKVVYTKYHKGLFLLAHNPKSSTENERSTVVVENPSEKQILFRQIAGMVARRIVTNSKTGDTAKQSEEFGFIKFGSRVDVLLPVETKITVKIGDKVKGGISILSEI